MTADLEIELAGKSAGGGGQDSRQDKEPISKLLTSRPMKRIKAGPGGLEIEYVDQALADARQELAAAKAQKPELTTSTEAAEAATTTGADDFTAEMSMLADVAPSAAVLESYARLERVLRQAVDAPRLPGTRRTASLRGLASYFDLKKWKPIPLCGSGFARRAVRVERVNGEIMLVSVIERARE